MKILEVLKVLSQNPKASVGDELAQSSDEIQTAFKSRDSLRLRELLSEAKRFADKTTIHQV